MFSNSRQILVTGGTFTDYNRGTSRGLERLAAASAPNALHNSSTRFDAPKCHPNTRIAVLDYIIGWIFGRNNPEALILWLYGPAGSGKSAILQTMAEKCSDLNILLASFFFSISDDTRNHPSRLVATIACQIATRIPQLAPVIKSAVDRDFIIFDKSISAQIQSLIVNPLKRLVDDEYFNDRTSSPRLVLLDGLDECRDKRLRAVVLRAIAQALSGHKLPLIFLIASRPEEDITHTFNSAQLRNLWKSLVLDNSFNPREDIHRFLADSFTNIKQTHLRSSFIPAAWPGEPTIEALTCKSSGQFIYASAVIKYVSALSDLPSRRLDMVMGLRPLRNDLPFAELDALYIHLLSAIPNPGPVLDILAIITRPGKSLSNECSVISYFLGLEDGDVEILLAPLTSIIDVKKASTGMYTSLSHASFSDFLNNQTRSRQFYISRSGRYSDNETVCQILKCFNKLQPRNPLVTYSSGHHFVEFLISTMPDIYPTQNLYEELGKVNFEARVKERGGTNWTWIARFLQMLKYIPNLPNFADQHMELQQVFRNQQQSIIPLIRSQIAPYLEDPTLTAYMILSLTVADGLSMLSTRDTGGQTYLQVHHTSVICHLLEMDDPMIVNDDPAAAKIIDTRIRRAKNSYPSVLTDFLFDPTTPGHLSLGEHHLKQLALRILHYLRGKLQLHPRVFPLRLDRIHRARPHRKKFTARTLRVMKLQKGQCLKPMRSFSGPCKIGLIALPSIIKRCSKSEQLTTFIKLHTKRMVVIRPYYQRVRDAFTDYLLRTEHTSEISDRPANMLFYKNIDDYWATRFV